MSRVQEWRAGSNNCKCHPETCCCDDWAVFNSKGDKYTTCNLIETAEEIASILNYQSREISK